MKAIINFCMALMCLNASAEVPLLNSRAVQCKPIEYSELDAMSADDLQAALCGYKVGNKISDDSSKVAGKNSNPDVQVHFAQERLKEIQACFDPQNVIGEMLKRKYPASTVNCSQFKGYDNFMNK